MTENKFDQNRYIAKFKKENYKRIEILIKKDDEELIEHLSKQANRNQYIIELIRKDIKDANQ